MKPNVWHWIGRVSFESALIVLAVILGFLVNAWREDARAEEQARAALERIEIELRANREVVAKAIPYHREVAAGIETLRKAPPTEKTLIEAFFTVAPKGVGDVLLRDDAWRTAQSRDALAAADFSTVQSVASAYALADKGVSATWSAIVDLFMEREAYLPATETVALTRLYFGYQELISQEQFLLQRYDAVLQKIARRGTAGPEEETK